MNDWPGVPPSKYVESINFPNASTPPSFCSLVGIDEMMRKAKKRERLNKAKGKRR